MSADQALKGAPKAWGRVPLPSLRASADHLTGLRNRAERRQETIFRGPRSIPETKAA
jgi:hypothetical protein